MTTRKASVDSRPRRYAHFVAEQQIQRAAFVVMRRYNSDYSSLDRTSGWSRICAGHP